MVSKVLNALGGDADFGGGVVALWGLTFKAGTDDLRDSPALEIAGQLVQRGFLYCKIFNLGRNDKYCLLR